MVVHLDTSIRETKCQLKLFVAPSTFTVDMAPAITHVHKKRVRYDNIAYTATPSWSQRASLHRAVLFMACCSKHIERGTALMWYDVQDKIEVATVKCPDLTSELSS